jgi:hypothetical protein
VSAGVADASRSTFPLTLSATFDPVLIAFIRLLIHDHEWHRLQKKGKLPSSEVDSGVAAILSGLATRRLSRYSQDLQVGDPLQHSMHLTISSPMSARF